MFRKKSNRDLFSLANPIGFESTIKKLNALDLQGNSSRNVQSGLAALF